MPPCTQYSTWVYKNQESHGELKIWRGNDRFVSLLCRSVIKTVLSKRTLGRLKQQKTGFYNTVDKMDHFLFAVLVIALHNDMHQTV